MDAHDVLLHLLESEGFLVMLLRLRQTMSPQQYHHLSHVFCSKSQQNSSMVLDKMKLLQAWFGALMAHLTDAMMAQYRCT